MDDKIKLYGRDDEERIVGIAPFDDESVLVFTRTEDDRVEKRVERLYPFYFLTDEGLESLKDFPRSEYKVQKLKGDAPYRNLVVFESWAGMWKSLRWVEENYAPENDEDPESARDEFRYIVTNFATQYLMQSGKTLFKGMQLNDLHRMQLDIETFSSRRGFPNAQREEDRIIIIALSDNRGWSRIIHAKDYPDEADMIIELVKEVHRRDPDVIEGWNIFSFDLPYIRDRAKMHRINLALGRNNKPPKTRKAKRKIAEREITYEAFEIAGRHVIDGMFLAAEWDVGARALPSLKLKEVAKFFGVAEPDREYVKGDDISDVWLEDPDRLIKYATDDVFETRSLVGKLAGATFYLTQMYPLLYQKVHLGGKASSIETLFVREYLRNRFALPKPEVGKQESGGYTDLFRTGVFDRIGYADVNSLYPSIMLNYDIQPHYDPLGYFQFSLSKLTELRLETKARAKAAYARGDTALGDELTAQEQSYKTIINSFYGMLGFLHALFNAIKEADRVAFTGQTLVKKMGRHIREMGGTIIEIDTDGILFIWPENVVTGPQIDEWKRDRPDEWALLEADEHPTHILDTNFIKRVSDAMPKGINVGFDGSYERMLSYRKKNYILREWNGKLKIKGGAFKSRGAEPFGRAFLSEVALAIMDKDVSKVAQIWAHYRAKIINRDWTIDDFKKRAVLKTGVKEYQEALNDNPNKNRMAQYELAAEDEEEALSGDVIEFYVSGTDAPSRVKVYEAAKLARDWTPGDENAAYYLNKRLNKFAEKFKPFFSKDDFGTLFDKKLDTNQMDLGLIERDYSRITIQTNIIKELDIL